MESRYLILAGDESALLRPCFGLCRILEWQSHPPLCTDAGVNLIQGLFGDTFLFYSTVVRSRSYAQIEGRLSNQTAHVANYLDVTRYVLCKSLHRGQSPTVMVHFTFDSILLTDFSTQPPTSCCQRRRQVPVTGSRLSDLGAFLQAQAHKTCRGGWEYDTQGKMLAVLEERCSMHSCLQSGSHAQEAPLPDTSFLHGCIGCLRGQTASERFVPERFRPNHSLMEQWF